MKLFSKLSARCRTRLATSLLLLLCTGVHGGSTDADNIISNGDFRSKDPEHRPLRWVEGRGSQTALISTKEHHGIEKDDASLEIASASADQTVLVRSDKHSADPGSVYLAQAWVKTVKGAPATFSLEFWSQAGVRIGVVSTTPNAKADWQQVQLSAAAPDQSTHMSLAIASPTNGAGISYWDDVSLAAQIQYEPKMDTGVRELFLDDYRLASLVKVQRVVHPGEKTAPLIIPDKPWEGRAVYIYGTVLKNEPAGTGYRMWYTTYHGGYFLCYATSEDGIHWQKPNLGIVDFKGSKENNITHPGGGALIYDPDDANPDRRYKLMDYISNPAQQRGYSVYFSPDGLHWTPYSGNPVISYGDVCQVAYDRQAHLFIASTKQRMLIANTSVTPGKQDRGAFISISTNFTDWSAPGSAHSQWSLGVEGDPADDLRVMAQGGIEAQIYGMPIYPYEKLYIGFPWMFDVMNYSVGIYASAGDGPIQPQLAVSRDLRHWSRPARDPVLHLGQAGAWDCGTLYTASTLLVSSNDMEIYFGAMNMGHGGDTKTEVQTARIARATWRRDGFESLHNAGDDPGVIITKPIEFKSASQLCVNAKLISGGSLTVEVLDQAGTPVPGFEATQCAPVTGDQPAAVLKWNNAADISRLAGQSIQLRFLLKGGDLYSYWFN